MTFREVIQVLLLFQIYEVTSFRHCDDCIKHTSCPEAFNINSFLETPESTFILFQGLCGYDGQTPKVCCSDFATEDLPSRINNEPDDGVLKMDDNLLIPLQHCGNNFQSVNRIYGSEIAELHELPWMALISTYIASEDKDFTCSGTIISSKFILTAAHCVINKRLAGVRVGEYIIDGKDCTLDYCDYTVQDFSVNQSIPHESYIPSGASHEYDIALIRLQGEIDFNIDGVATICLPITPTLREGDLTNLTGIVAGWGDIETSVSSMILRKVKITIERASSCHWSTKNTICAGNKGRDSCKGDSGGPLMIQHSPNFQYVQYGIVSFGSGICGTGPSVYTDVRKYIDWILKRINV